MDYRNQSPPGYATRGQTATYDTGLRSYMLSIYNYMGSALALTGIMAYLGSHWAPLLEMMYRENAGHLALSGFGLLVAFTPLAFLLVLNMGINRLSLPAAQGIFWTFAAVFGLSMSSVFLLYSGQSIARVFFITSIAFCGMSLVGYSSKRDLTAMGSFLMMGVIGIFASLIVNMFLQSSALLHVISILGVLIFTGLIAYDTQKLKAIYYYSSGNSELAAKSSILGAVTLYLDFINLFRFLLVLMGDRRN